MLFHESIVMTGFGSFFRADHLHGIYNALHFILVRRVVMLEYSKEDVDHVGDVLEKLYGSPQLCLNHCTGEDAIQQLRNRFGPDIVHDCHVGTELEFLI